MRRIDMLVSEAIEKKRRAAETQERINALQSKLLISCGISDKEKFAALLSSICDDADVVSAIEFLMRTGRIRVTVNYKEFMKKPMLLLEDGDIEIADNATLAEIRTFLDLPHSSRNPRRLSGNLIVF